MAENIAAYGGKNSGLFPKLRSKQKIQMPPSVSEAHIEIRQALDKNIFLLSNGDLGVVYEVAGVYDEALTHEELNSEAFPFFKLVRALVPGIPNHTAPGNVIVHVICSQRVVKDKIQISAVRTSMEPSIAQRIIEREEDLLFEKGMVSRKFYIGVRYSVPRQRLLDRLTQSIKDAVGKKDSSILEDIDKQAQYFHEELEQKEIESGLSLRRIDATELIAYYNSVLNCGEPLPYPVDCASGGNNEFVSLHSLVMNEPCEAKPDGLFFEDGKTIRTFLMKMLPKQYLLGRMRRFMDDLPIKNFDLVWIFGDGKVQPDNQLELRKLWFARGPAHQSKLEDLLNFSGKIDNLRPYGKMGVRLLVYMPDQQNQQKSTILDKAVSWLGVPVIEEKQQALHFIVSSLPINCQKYGLAVPGRYITTRLEAAIGFLPIYDGPTLSDPACRYWASRAKTPTCWDMFKGQDNRMTVVLGRSGAGKSCLNSQLILEFLARFPDGIVRVLDRRTSYQKLCDIYDGQVVEFSERHLKKNPFSPFYAENYDEDIVATILALIETVIAQTNKGEQIKLQHTEVLKEAISRALNEHIRNLQYSQETGAETYGHIIWDPDIKSKLYDAAMAKDFKGYEQVVDDLVRWTIGLGESGVYGFIFSKHEKKRLDTANKRIVVYDLQDIAQENLQTIAAQLAFMKIALDIRRESKSTPKLVIFEELGVLLQGDNAQTQAMANKFVREVVKTCRKTNSIAIGITNDVEDYTTLPGGKTFWNQSTQKIFLPSTRKMVEELQVNFKELSSADLQIIDDLRIDKKEKYSQAYLISEISPYKGSFDIPLSENLDALVTTSPDQLELYDRLRKKGIAPDEAIEAMGKEHPFGEGL